MWIRIGQQGRQTPGGRVQRGFSLIELMVVVAIIAILASIAYPSYSRYAFRARRADGHEMLMRVAAAQERYYTNFNKYATALGSSGLGFSASSGCGVGGSEHCHYEISMEVAADGQTYTLTAEPKGVQAADKCKNLTINNVGLKGKSGDESNGKCW